MSAAYRVQQFIRAAAAWIRPVGVDVELLERYLSPKATDLFRTMPNHDRQHALNVFYTLQRQGHSEPDLLAAALLHDAGKNIPGGSRLWHRVAAVLMRAFWPGLLERLGQEEQDGWRRAFYVQQHHPALGAELARHACCSPVTVDLILRHEDPPVQGHDPILAALQAADSTN